MSDILKDFGDKTKTAALALLVAAAIFLACKLVMYIISKITKSVIDNQVDKKNPKSKSLITSMTVVRSVCRYAVYVIAILVILDYLGVKEDASNAFVAAGIGGLVISLGAQSFIKDLLSGFLILFERQYEVGDRVKINDFEGKVTAISMRSTYLDVKGQKVIIPNGQVETVTNLNNSYNALSFVVPTAYEANTKKVIDVIQKVLDKYYEEHKNLFVEKPVVQGVKEYAESSINLSIYGRCLPLEQYAVERELKLLIKEEFDRKKIEIPYQKIIIKK